MSEIFHDSGQTMPDASGNGKCVEVNADDAMAQVLYMHASITRDVLQFKIMAFGDRAPKRLKNWLRKQKGACLL